MLNDELIEFVFNQYDDIKRAIVAKRLDPGGAVKTGGNGSGHSLVSDTTAIRAIRNACELNRVYVEYWTFTNNKRICHGRVISRPEAWIMVVDRVKEHYKGVPKGEIITRKYDLKEDFHKTCKALDISKTAYYMMCKDILHFAELCAVGYGILSPFSNMRKGIK